MNSPISPIFRFEFYNRAKTAFAIVATGKDYYIDGQNSQLIFFFKKCPLGEEMGGFFIILKKSHQDLSNEGSTLKSLIEEQTRINEQAWKKVTPCLLIY